MIDVLVFLFYFVFIYFNTAWKQPSRVLLTSAPLHNQVMGHSAGIMSSLWVWSSPCFLSSIHQSPSPSSVMLPGSLLTSAATRIHHHPWRLCKRWVWLHVCVRACVYQLSCAIQMVVFLCIWLCHSRLSHAELLQHIFSSQISLFTPGNFWLESSFADNWSLVLTAVPLVMFFSPVFTFIYSFAYFQPTHNLLLSPQILPALCVLIYHTDINVSIWLCCDYSSYRFTNVHKL